MRYKTAERDDGDAFCSFPYRGSMKKRHESREFGGEEIFLKEGRTPDEEKREMQTQNAGELIEIGSGSVSLKF